MLRADIYDKNMVWQRPLGAWKNLSCTKRFNAIGEASVTVKSSHQDAHKLAEPGTRLVLTFRDRPLMSGPVRLRSGSGPGRQGELTFSLQSDERVLWNFLGYQNPEGTATKTGQAVRERLELKGPAEWVLKEFWRRNVMARAVFPVGMAPILNRGNSITVNTRMHILAEQILPAWVNSGLGFEVVQRDGKLTLDVFEPRLYPNALTEASRVITAWSFNDAGPEVTRVVVAGQGEGIAREYYAQTDAVLESIYGDTIETHVDARDTADGETHQQRAAITLAEGAPKGTVAIELAETGNFRYGTPAGVNVGDIVTARFGPGVEITDVLQEVKIDHTPGDGLKITSQIGRSDDPDRLLMQAITALAAGVRDLKASR
ncbi:Gp37-like protein [Arthrobacter sp. USHLN218]|uniref:Gp37-like protein n=1 Tax=Arthrobacter sp. USHLN218 TaxID=3081232 RepID=UPI003015A4C0